MSRLTPPLNSNDHVRCNPGAPAQLVEYGDFECPFCGSAYSVVKALEEALGDRLAVAFRHFPLTQMHPHAMLAAEAAEAAGAQGRFWEMHDMLYEHQDALEPDDLRGYAEALGLDVDVFDRDLLAHKHRPKVRADFRSGAVSGVNGTPTFFINGHRYDGAWDVDSLFAAIASEAGATLSE